MKTRKVMELQLDGHWYICIQDYTAKRNQYKLYHKYYDCGYHRKRLAEYDNIDSVLFHLLQMKYPKVAWDLT